jgi:hypothetical protein
MTAFASASNTIRLGYNRCALCGEDVKDGGLSVGGRIEDGYLIGGTYYHSRCVPRPDHEVEVIARTIASAIGGVDISRGLDCVTIAASADVNLLRVARVVLQAWAPKPLEDRGVDSP